jgi:hypothetical protein
MSWLEISQIFAVLGAKPCPAWLAANATVSSFFMVL